MLPNAGGVYVEGLESGSFDEEINLKTEAQKEETKEQLDNLLTTLISPKSNTYPRKNLFPHTSVGLLAVKTESSDVKSPLNITMSQVQASSTGLSATINTKDENSSEHSVKQKHVNTVQRPVTGSKNILLNPTSGTVLKPACKGPLSPISRTVFSPTSVGTFNPASRTLLSPTSRTVLSSTSRGPLSPKAKKSSTKWFSLASKAMCEDTKIHTN